MKESNLKGIKVLVAEDQESHFAVLKKTLMQIGFEKIDWAGNGKEAVAMVVAEAAKKTPYKLIISDINMPVMDGIEFLKTVRRNKSVMISKVCFIITSAVNEQEKVIEAVTYGASDYVIKPVELDLFLQKIGSLILLKEAS